jgi:hypothetical protein
MNGFDVSELRRAVSEVRRSLERIERTLHTADSPGDTAREVIDLAPAVHEMGVQMDRYAQHAMRRTLGQP